MQFCCKEPTSLAFGILDYPVLPVCTPLTTIELWRKLKGYSRVNNKMCKPTRSSTREETTRNYALTAGEHAITSSAQPSRELGGKLFLRKEQKQTQAVARKRCCARPLHCLMQCFIVPYFNGAWGPRTTGLIMEGTYQRNMRKPCKRSATTTAARNTRAEVCSHGQSQLALHLNRGKVSHRHLHTCLCEMKKCGMARDCTAEDCRLVGLLFSIHC
jgi:hypothetical protein